MNENMTVTELLEKLRESVLTHGWTQEVYARDAEGAPTAIHAKNATSFCFLGNIFYTANNLGIASDTPVYKNATRAIIKVLQPESMTTFNDKAGRTKEEIIEVIDKAITLLKTEGESLNGGNTVPG